MLPTMSLTHEQFTKDDYNRLYWEFFHESQDYEHTFREREIIQAIQFLLENLYGREPGTGLTLLDISKMIKKLDDWTYTEDQLNYVVHTAFPRGDWDVLPWEKPVNTDSERIMYQSQKEANLTKAYMDTFSRPSIARYL